jgi:hypothetical protein
LRIPRLTYGNVTATLALFVALGGTSYAAITITGASIKNGTVTGSDIKDGSLKGGDVGNGSLTGSDLENGSVTGADIADGSLAAADFPAGELPVGPAGPAGPAGPQGPAGPGAFSDVVARRVEQPLSAESTAEATASCANGETAVGGGSGHSGPMSNQLVILAAEPLDATGTPPDAGERATQWRTFARNNGNDDRIMYVYALCTER